jgi:hypothetical protein
MRVDPPLHPLNLIEVFVAELLAATLFLGAARYQSIQTVAGRRNSLYNVHDGEDFH